MPARCNIRRCYRTLILYVLCRATVSRIAVENVHRSIPSINRNSIPLPARRFPLPHDMMTLDRSPSERTSSPVALAASPGVPPARTSRGGIAQRCHPVLRQLYEIIQRDVKHTKNGIIQILDLFECIGISV